MTGRRRDYGPAGSGAPVALLFIGVGLALGSLILCVMGVVL